MIQTVTLQGAEELKRILSLLPVEMEQTILRDGTKAAMEPMLAAAKAKCPVYQGPPRADVTPGALRDSLKISTFKSKRGVGARVVAGAGDFKGEQYYAMMVEFGHGIGKRPYRGKKTKNTADNRKRVPEHPFIRPAYDENKTRAVDILASAVRAGIASVTGKT